MSQKIIDSKIRYYADNGLFTNKNLTIERAHGASIIDSQWVEYIDLIANAGSLNVGHTHKKIVNSVIEQTKLFISYSPAYIPNEAMIHLAKKGSMSNVGETR